MRFFFVAIFYSFLTIHSVHGQIFEGNDANKLVQGAQKVILHKSHKTIQFIELDKKTSIAEKDKSKWLNTTLSNRKFNMEFEFKKMIKDPAGYTHYEYRQKVNGVHIEYGIYKIHCKDQKVVSANGEYYNFSPAGEVDIVTANSLTSIQKSREHALMHFENTQSNHDQTEATFIETVYYPSKNKSLMLCHKFDIYDQGAYPRRSYLYISVVSKQIIFEENRIRTTDVIGAANTKYCGLRNITTDSVAPSLYLLKENGLRKIHTLNLNSSTSLSAGTDFTDTDNFWDSTLNNENTAYDAHFGAEQTWDYFQNVFSRNSYDDAGAEIISYVHYGSGIVNAFWDGNQVKYGDGDGVNYSPLTSTDVVAHEITHALTEYTSGLVYANESGALNESFSDIFGVTIDFYANPSTANFLVGDQFSATGIPFRTMNDPHASLDPDTYQGVYWDTAQEVHQNSNVQNYWYYLICHGGAGVNDNGESYLVNSITMDHAAAIAYRTLTTYLTPNADYADARTYSIQSAIDLYGACSFEVINVTNAWHAVGVGGVFLNAVIAQFATTDTLICGLPASVSFQNLSLNGTSYYWDFGDGDTSSLLNPIHLYNSLGVFTVTFIVNGTALCGNADTMIMTNYITITNNPVPISALCIPGTSTTCCGYGIEHVSLQTINRFSGDAGEGYVDFTCGNNATLVAGGTYPIEIKTFSSLPQFVKVFIDYDQDGSFSNTESVYASPAGIGIHFGYINSSLNAPLNTPLRMRVISSSNPINFSCGSIINGQAEDYTILFVHDTLAPVADFIITNPSIKAGNPVYFQDISANAPTNWTWTFGGASTTLSALQNPNAFFLSSGTYAVTLIVTNAYGSDTLTKNIIVDDSFYLCNPGMPQSSLAISGHLNDSGGPLANYQDGENCGFLIMPLCSDSILLHFLAFDTEPGYDILNVYDGINNSGVLLFSGSGNVIPSDIKAISGNMFIEFISDASYHFSGFEASWIVFSSPSSILQADFNFMPLNPPLMDTVDFVDLSSVDTKSWLWDFGDGSFSTLQNPAHVYTTSGIYTVTLISSSCFTNDTIIKTIQIQSAPVVNYLPSSFSLSLSCNDSVVLPLMIQNSGTGSLNWSAQTLSDAQYNKLLIWTYGVDLSPGSSYHHLLSAINQYYADFSIDTCSSILPSVLQNKLIGNKVLLIPGKQAGNAITVSLFTTVFQNFVQEGGTLIVCGDGYTLENTGIFNSVFAGSTTGLLTLFDNSTTISQSVPAFFNGVNTTYYRTITNPDKISIIRYDTLFDVVTTVPYGNGNAIYVGFDYFSYGNEQARIISNAIQYGMHHAAANMNLSQLNGTLSGIGMDSIEILFTSKGLSSGTDTFYVIINTNDPTHLKDSIPVYINISGIPCAYFSHTSPGNCNGVIGFTDSSSHNPLTWFWSFGDGDTSTLQNPVHHYLNPGTYTVKLVAGNMLGADSISKTITITSADGPIAALCSPQTLSPNSIYGITHVDFNTIHQTSTGALAGYEDMTCSSSTHLFAGTSYLLSVTTLNGNEQVSVWIDYSNDGAFDISENVALMLSNGDTLHQAMINIPSSGLTLGTPLRMRLISDHDTILSSCQQSLFGQCEDYTVKVKINMTPVANFMANLLVAWVGQTVHFTDTSSHIPLNWNWDIAGATPSTSNLQHPAVFYNSPGIYDVGLIAGNNDGSDTVVYSSYIQVNPLPNAGFTYHMNPCTGEVSFYASLPTPYFDNAWQFGDSTFINFYSPIISHIYASSGNYLVKFIAKSPYGNDTILQNITVTLWEPSIQHTGLLQVGQAIDFDIQSNLPIAGYIWNFGDGSALSSLSNPLHTYNSNGGYIVISDVTYDSTCHLLLFDTLNIVIPSGVDDLSSFSPQIILYPNPFDHEIKLHAVDMQYAEKMDISVMNILGETLYFKHEQNIDFQKKDYTIDYSFSPGTYLINIDVDSLKFVQQIQKK